MIKVLALALGLAQLRSCANTACAALDLERYAAHRLALAATAPQRIVDCAVVPGALLVVSAADYSPTDFERVVQRWSERRGAESLVSIRLRDVIGEGIAASADGRWWYTVAGNYENRWGVLFMTPETASAGPRFVPLPIAPEHQWVPLKGDVPAGLHFRREHDETVIMEVTADGVARTWTIPGAERVRRGWWAAERLANGSIALASLEALPEQIPSKVILRILRSSGDEPSYDEYVLQSGGAASRIRSAVDRSGAVTIVVERPEGAIEAFVVEPRSGKSKRLTLSGAKEKARFPFMTATAAGAVVAWADVASRPPVLRARSIENGSAGLIATTVGNIVVNPDRDLWYAIAADGDEALFAWERGDGFAQRRLPAALAGFELVSALKERLCAFGRTNG